MKFSFKEERIKSIKLNNTDKENKKIAIQLIRWLISPHIITFVYYNNNNHVAYCNSAEIFNIYNIFIFFCLL